MKRRVILSMLVLILSVGLLSNDIMDPDVMRNMALQGINMEVGNEQEMAAWSYYRLTGESGVEKNYAEAVKILKKLVTRDPRRVAYDKFTFVVEGYNMLGNCYEKGQGVTKDLDKARYYWQLAADYDHAEALTSLSRYPAPQPKQSLGNFTQTLPGTNITFNMVYVQGGTFQMGSNDSEAYSDEKPIHSVTLSDYYIGETEVTQELWEAVMGNNPSYFKGSNKPVERVSWDDCQEFIRKLNQKTGKNFCLPTEAQWEYAARGGNKSRGYKYAGSNTIGDVAWYYDNSSSSTHPVGTKLPNELGLYDMSGNVWEWCSDWDGDYSTSSQTNPMGPSTGSDRVLRGGCWYNGAHYCRVAYRYSSNPDRRIFNSGFRLACGL